MITFLLKNCLKTLWTLESTGQTASEKQEKDQKMEPLWKKKYNTELDLVNHY